MVEYNERISVSTDLTREQLDKFIELFGNTNKSRTIRSIILDAMSRKENEQIENNVVDSDEKLG
jgi:hypothetical protein